MTNIVLIGLRGSGKSTIGFKLARAMKRKFIDTDHEIERQEHLSTRQIISKKGWNYFRKIEKYVVRRVSKEQNAIIATGGGAVIDLENRKALTKNGFIVYLKTDPETLASRLESDEERPRLTNNEKLLDEIKEMYEKRDPIYAELAQLIFTADLDTDDLKHDVKNAVKKLNLQLQSAKEEFSKPNS